LLSCTGPNRPAHDGRSRRTCHGAARQSGRIVTRVRIEARLAAGGETASSNALEEPIHRLRRKLGAERIGTPRGMGHLLDA
jgi:DNA-binding response OmpR family regulator